MARAIIDKVELVTRRAVSSERGEELHVTEAGSRLRKLTTRLSETDDAYVTSYLRAMALACDKRSNRFRQTEINIATPWYKYYHVRDTYVTSDSRTITNVSTCYNFLD